MKLARFITIDRACLHVELALLLDLSLRSHKNYVLGFKSKFKVKTNPFFSDLTDQPSHSTHTHTEMVCHSNWDFNCVMSHTCFIFHFGWFVLLDLLGV